MEDYILCTMVDLLIFLWGNLGQSRTVPSRWEILFRGEDRCYMWGDEVFPIVNLQIRIYVIFFYSNFLSHISSFIFIFVLLSLYPKRGSELPPVRSNRGPSRHRVRVVLIIPSSLYLSTLFVNTQFSLNVYLFFVFDLPKNHML